MSVSNESPIQVNYHRPRSSGFHASAQQPVALICNQGPVSLKSRNPLAFSCKTFPQHFVQTSCPTCVTRLKLAPTKKQMLTQKLNLRGRSGVASLTPGFGDVVRRPSSNFRKTYDSTASERQRRTESPRELKVQFHSHS